MPEAGTILPQIGHFRIEKKLARGGFGDVYRALNTKENRTVALKLLEHDLTDPVVMEAEKFGTALQTHLCRIEPRVVTVHDSGDLDGYFFVEMAYVDGKDLSKLLTREGRFDPARAAAIIAELCVALASAHSFPLEVDGRQLRAICHGDIKPNNILLEQNDQLHVVDFGTAKGLTLTRRQTSNSIGSVEYFSPERLRTGQVDEMSDLWAVAVVLFELIEGHRPFEAATPERLEQRIQSGVDPQEFSTSSAPALSDVLHKSLHRDPSRRYQSAREFEADLRRFLAAEQTEASKLLADEPGEGAVSRSAAWGAETRRTEVPSSTVRTGPSPSTVRGQPSMSAVRTWGPGWSRAMSIVARPRNWALAVFGVCALLLLGEASSCPGAMNLRKKAAAREIAAKDVWTDFQRVRNRSILGVTPWLAGYSVRSVVLEDCAATIDDFRTGDNPKLHKADWVRCETNTRNWLTWIGRDSEATAVHAYSLAHVARISGQYHKAIENYQLAARSNKRWPDPYLGMARVYFYGLRDVERGREALEEAEGRGFTLGRREQAQIADGYRIRGIREQKSAEALEGESKKAQLSKANEDFESAIEHYLPIVGWGDVVVNLRDCERRTRQVKDQIDRLDEESGGWRWPW
ncbi:MAG: serine/threonine protein kinase [Acidobacteria bacterium]|nr:MAG: serine/threonine protein kinase [Acidobacteriota bacterium]